VRERDWWGDIATARTSRPDYTPLPIALHLATTTSPSWSRAGWSAGPKRRGLAMGLNEAAGYRAVAVTAHLTGLIAARAGPRPEPFYPGLACAGLGLGLSAAPPSPRRRPPADGLTLS
jgi:predicted MFS family arabinose efflux permease